MLFDRDGRPKLVKATLELADAASQALDLRRLYLFNISRHRPSAKLIADTSAKARYIQKDVVHIPSDSVVSTSREGTWQEVSAHLGSVGSRFGCNIKDAPLGQIAAHPRLVHVSQGTYKEKRTRIAQATASQHPTSIAKYGRRAFRSHLNLSLGNAGLEQ